MVFADCWFSQSNRSHHVNDLLFVDSESICLFPDGEFIPPLKMD